MLVTVTDFAVTFSGADGVELVDPPLGVESDVADTMTQSPMASEDRVVVDVEVKRVEESKLMLVGPLVCCTDALSDDAAMTLPDTESNDAPRVVAPDPLFAVVDALLPDDPPPQPATATAIAVPPTATDTRRVLRRDSWLTLTPLMGATYSVRRASMGASRAARVAG